MTFRNGFRREQKIAHSRSLLDDWRKPAWVAILGRRGADAVASQELEF
jgi:hypothetical protein